MKDNFKTIIILLLCFLLPLNIYALSKNNKQEVSLVDCVDGDTAKLKINGKTKTVRFLAIDTEESVSKTKLNTYMGKIASVYTCNKLTNASKIEIEYDENSDKEDKYNRQLVWIYVDDDLLQDLIVSKGYGKIAYLYGKYNYIEDLKESEKNAKDLEIGIWNEHNIIEEIYNFVQKVLKIFT